MTTSHHYPPTIVRPTNSSHPQDTSEGLEITHALEYFSRFLFTWLLLPLLRRSASARSPRVVSVLSGHNLSRSFKQDDLLLENPGAFGGIQSQTQMGIMNTLSLDKLAVDPENARISFIHTFPGAVETGNMVRSGTYRVPLGIMLKPLFWAVGLSAEEAGQRHLFAATSALFGEQGPAIEGVTASRTREGGDDVTGRCYLINEKGETKHDAAILADLREQAQEKAWQKTMDILKPYL